ncbi:MAG: hypothetical protein FGM14_04450 [Flavobacteriales bacterium]|nr:hypothetical protein [Flavobacteriales bacterium]
MNRLSLNSFFIAFFIGLLCLFSGGSNRVFGQSTFSWNGTYGGTGTNRTFTGTAVSGVTMTATIVNSENVWQESSPKWIASGTTSSFGTSCSALTTTNQGLLLSTNWTTNTTKTITTTITFSSAIKGQVKFFVYDINDDGYGSIYEQVEVSAVSPSGSALNISRTNPTCVQNGGGSVAGNNSTTLILNAGNTSSACTCWGNNEVIVGNTNDCISTITIRYRSMSGNNNNPDQYIVISNLTGTVQSVTAPTAITGNTTICSGGSTTLTATGGTATSQWFTGSCGGTLVGTGASTTVSPTSNTTYFVRNFTSPCGFSSCVSTTVNITPAIDWANTNFPASGSICNGFSFDVYGQVYIAGVTETGGQGTGVTAELGWSTTNSNPSTWTNWTSAVFNSQQGNNDQFFAQLTNLASGTYYYAFRYALNGCSYTYGGTGGIWSNNSGVLTVNDCFGTYASAPNLTSCNTTVSSQGAYYNSSGSGANLINSNSVNFQGYNFGSYFQNSAGLILKGAEIKTFKNNTGNVCSARMYYRVYPSGSPSGAFTSVNLPFYDNCSGGAFPTGGPCNTGDQKWRDIAQNIDLTTYSAGTYSLEVYYEISGSHTSTSGCGTTQFLNNSGANYISSFTILAAPTANNTGSYCEGTGTVTLSASNGGTSYSWSGPNSFTSSTQNPTNGSPSTSNAGTYTVTVNLGGCTQTAQTTVTVNPIPSVIANSNSPICAGQSLNLTSTDGYNSYAWSGPNSFSNATQNPTLTNFQAANAGTYTVTVTGTGGCQATSSTVVALTTSPSAANNGPVCVGGSLSLSTNSATSYSWSGPNSFTSNVQNPTVSASATTAMAGTYTVSVIGTCAAATGVVDNFSDGNFTANPVWTVQAGGFVGSSNFLKGNSTDTDDIISTPSTQVYGTWNFDYRFHTTAYTSVGDQFVAFFVTSTNAGLQNSNGYYVYVESSGQLLLRRRNGVSAATTIISATISGTNELNTNWHTIKVIRGFTGLFELYFDGVLKGTGTDNTYTTSTHLGPWIHGKFATDNHEVDNISCSPPATAQTIVVVDAGPSIAAKTGTICSGSTYTLSTAAPDVVPGGTTYSWSFTANPNITGATTGTNQTGFTQTLTNTSGLPQTIVYSVTPSSGTCSGTPFTVTITVDAPLNGGTVSTDQTICSGATPAPLTNTLLPSGGTGLGITGSVQIGTQIWMNRNLDVVNYNDGTAVGTNFIGTAGAYSWYNNSYPTWGQYYGPLYNWYAVNTGKLCPQGWHVPTKTEWNTMINFVGNTLNAGKKLKSCRTVTYGCPTTQDPRWDADNTTFGTDDFGFSALPAGRAYISSGSLVYERVRTRTRFWASSQNDVSNGDTYEFNDISSGVTVFYNPKDEGYSVRCMGDNATTIQNSYTYQWQQDPGCTNNWTDISGANGLTYSPGALTQTTCFRRVTTDACGTAFSNTITITVNPAPAITNMTATICSGTAFTATPVQGTNGTVPAGTTYTWSAPTMTGVSGGSAQATAQTSISQTLTNTTTSNATATYTVTPTTGSCPGATFTVTVTVLPPFTTGTVQGISTGGGGPTNLVIYQVYGGGGSGGATYPNDFVVLYNPTPISVPLTGWSLQYASSTGTSWSSNNLSGTIQSGKYFLIQMGAGTSLPVSFDLQGSLSIAATAAKIALVNSTTSLSGSCPTGGNIVDFVGFGTGTDCREGTGTTNNAPAPSTTTWITRQNNGCQDTQVNSADFTAGTASIRNSSNTNTCTTTSNTETICAGQNASSITATAASGANGSFTYQWYSQAGNVTCPTGSSTAGWTPIAGETNLTYSPGAVSATTTYALYVTATGTNNCGGAWSTDCRKVIVNPAPIISNITTTICSGTAFTGTPVNGTNGTVPSGTTYTWTVAANTNVTGQSAQATAQSAISQTLTNTTSVSQTVVYTVTPTTGSCVGTTFTVSVTVDPKPVLSNGTVSACTGVPFSFTPTGTNIPSGTTYSWSAPSGTNFSGGAAGSGATTVDGTLTLTSGTAATAVYTVTPTSGSCSGNTFTVSVGLSSCAPATPFTACNLVVYRVGDGSTTLTNAAVPVSIQEVSTTGSVVQTVSSLFVGSNLLTQGGTSTSSGFLNSNNGYLAVPGLNTTLGTASASAENSKVTHIIDGSVTLNSRILHPTTGTMPFTSNTYRSVVPVTATTFYCAGTATSTGGVWYYDGASFTQIYNTQNNVRNIEIFNGNLYVSIGAGTARGIYQIGTGLPTTTGQTATLLFSNDQANSSVYNFSISPDGCTAYLADDGTGALALAGITKFIKTSGVWSSSFTYTASGSTRGLVVDYTTSNPKIYATTAPSNGVVCNTLISLTDNGTSFTSNWSLAAGSNYGFDGVDFTPNSTTSISVPDVTAQSFNVCQNGTSQTITATATSPSALTYQWYSNTVNDFCGATAIPSATNATYTPPVNALGTTYYFLMVKGPCSNYIHSTLATVTVNANPTASIAPTTLCAGSTATLTASGGGTYLWSPGGQTTNQISINSAGTYSVTVTDSNNCTNSASTTISISNPPSINAISPP